MTRSPFPGMDPWMEHRWADAHARLIIYVANQLQRQLPEPLIASAEEAVSINALGAERPTSVRPDVSVAEAYELREAAVAEPPPASDVAKPLLVLAHDPALDRHVQIIDPSSGNRVITAIEVLSPSNKLPGDGRRAYQSKQHHFVCAGVNLIEIDFVRVG